MMIKKKKDMNRIVFMRNFRQRIVFYSVMIVLSATANAQTEPLLLTDALHYALQNSADAKKALLNVENSQYLIDEAKSSVMPTISGTSSLLDQYKKQKFVLDGAITGHPGQMTVIESGTTWNAGAGINLDQTLFNQSAILGLKAAKSTREFYQLNSILTEEQVIELVATAYYKVMEQKQSMTVIETNISNGGKTLAIINDLYKNGMAKKIDLDRATVHLSNLNAQLRQSLNALAQMENYLKFYMGMPMDRAVTIPLSELENIHPSLQGVDNEPDLTNRTEILVLKRQNELLTLNKKLQQSKFYPSLSLSGNYSVSGVSNQFVLFRGKEDGGNWFGHGNVGVNMRIPIFNGNATRAQVRQADVSIRKNEEDLKNMALSLNMAKDNAQSQMHNSILNIDSQKENEILAKQIFENTLNNYHNGLATLSDLLDAETALAQAQNNYCSALFAYRLAEIQLIKSQGNLKSLL